MVKKIYQSFVITAVCALCSLTAQSQNQNQLVAKLSTDSFSAFKFEESQYGKKGKAVAAGKAPWTLKINKQGDKDASGAEVASSIILNRAGVVEETFQADLPGHPAYFFSDLHRAIVLDGKIFYYAWKNAADIKYVLVPAGGSFSGEHSEWKSKVETTQNRLLDEQKNVRTEIASAQEKAEQAEKAANSLKGKSVRQIRVKWLEIPTVIGHLTKLKYGIEAELVDGKVLKTNNLGGTLPWDDFDIEVSGAEFGEEMVTVWADASKIPNDKVVINVKSKHGAHTASISTDVMYNEKYVANHEGLRNVLSNGAGSDGMSLIVLTKADRTAQGKPVTKVEINNAETGKTLHRIKLSPGTGLQIVVRGGNGSERYSESRGGAGGNGGDVTVIQDPGVSNFALVVDNKGGKGGPNRNMAGPAGKDGRYENKKQPVSLSW